MESKNDLCFSRTQGQLGALSPLRPELWAALTEILMILSNMTSGGTWKSKTKYCGEEGKHYYAVFLFFDLRVREKILQQILQEVVKTQENRQGCRALTVAMARMMIVNGC